MEQKRFLTADEVFQLFGVDADALGALVESGAVKALPDLGKFKYRSEDFVSLVDAGKLVPRTSAEMFQVDSKGDIPFLKVKSDDQGLQFSDDVSFMELDEAALNEQATQKQPTPKTAIFPEEWFGDTFDADAPKKSSDTPRNEPISLEEKTDVDFSITGEKHLTPDSDSNVQIIGDDATIDYDEPEIASSASDSDVRLEGPVSSASSIRLTFPKKPDSDSDVRLSKLTTGAPIADSNVTVVSSPGGRSDSESNKADSDSDVQLVSPHAAGERPSVNLDVSTTDSDSDVVLVASDKGTNVSGPPKASVAEADSDSDVRIASSSTPVTSSYGASIEVEKADSDIRLESETSDSGISLEPVKEGSGPSFDPAKTDSDIVIEPDSGITLQAEEHDSGISIDPGSGITLQSAKTDSEISLNPVQGDSGISLSADPDSGISMEEADSGIRFESAGDSGIRLSADSGITFEEDVNDPGATIVGAPSSSASFDGSSTQTLDLSGELPQDSGFDVSLAESANTIEMLASDESSDTVATNTPKGRSKGTPPSKPLSLSEAFQLDDPLDVEELDISSDLDSSLGSDEFAEVEEEVLEASDDDFSAGEVSMAEVDEAEEDSDAFAPAAKVRATPKEPGWGLVAIIPIGGASLALALTVMVLWGGIATMWTGAQAPEPAGTLISILGGLIG